MTTLNTLSPELTSLIRTARAKYTPDGRVMLCRDAAIEALELACNMARVDLECADLATVEDVHAIVERMHTKLGDDFFCFYFESADVEHVDP